MSKVPRSNARKKKKNFFTVCLLPLRMLFDLPKSQRRTTSAATLSEIFHLNFWALVFFNCWREGFFFSLFLFFLCVCVKRKLSTQLIHVHHTCTRQLQRLFILTQVCVCACVYICVCVEIDCSIRGLLNFIFCLLAEPRRSEWNKIKFPTL